MNHAALCYDENHSTPPPPKDPRDIPAKWINYSILGFLYATASFLLWKAIALKQYNLIIAGATFALILFLFPSEIITAKWFAAIKRSRLLFSVALVFGFGTAALVSREFDPNIGIPSVYLGCFHIHHWWWSSIRLGGILHILVGLRIQNPTEQKKFYNTHANFELLVAGLLFALFVFAFLEKDLFPNTLSFRLVSGWLGAVSLILGLLLKSNAPRALGFKRVLAALLGIATGIWVEGFLLGLIPNFSQTITFWECLK
jgi:hypothetical protein